MLFCLALLFKSDILAQMLMWLCWVLSAWWIFEMGRREAPLAAVLLSCLMLATHTGAMLLASTTYVESLVMLWTTAAVFCFLRWEELGPAGPPQRGWLSLSALFTGLALGTKYYAGITAGTLGFFLTLRIFRGERRARALDLGLFVSIVTVLFLPWMLKNTLEVGNPLFPFFYRYFPMTGIGWNAATARGYFHVFTEYGHAENWALDLVFLPFRLLVNSPRFGGGMDVLGGLGWDLVFWSVPLGLWAGWKNQFMRGAALFCGFYLAVWFFTGVVLRFLIPISPLLCLLSGYGLYTLWGVLGPMARAALAAGGLILTLSHLMLFAFVNEGVVGSGRILLGLEGREEFLSRRLAYYSCARYARERLGGQDKVLIVGEQRGYYVAQEHMVTSIHAPNRFASWADEAQDPEDFARRLRREGFSRILWVPQEAARLGVVPGSFTAKGLNNWLGLNASWLKLDFQAPGCSLYEIKAVGSGRR
jgi:hypothetical protein